MGTVALEPGVPQLTLEGTYPRCPTSALVSQPEAFLEPEVVLLPEVFLEPEVCIGAAAVTSRDSLQNTTGRNNAPALWLQIAFFALAVVA